MQQLGADLDGERAGPLFDQAHAEMDMPEQASLCSLLEARAGLELERPPDIVEKRGGKEKVGPQARMKLAQLPADRGHADGVLEQPPRVDVVALRRRRQGSKGSPHRGVAEDIGDRGSQTGMRDLRGEKFEKPFQLVGVAPERRRELCGIGALRKLDRPHVELKMVAKALDTAEHSYGVSLREPPVEQVDVLPDAAVDSPTRVDELECKVVRPGPRAEALLARDGKRAFDDAVLGQL